MSRIDSKLIAFSTQLANRAIAPQSAEPAAGAMGRAVAMRVRRNTDQEMVKPRTPLCSGKITEGLHFELFEWSSPSVDENSFETITQDGDVTLYFD